MMLRREFLRYSVGAGSAVLLPRLAIGEEAADPYRHFSVGKIGMEVLSEDPPNAQPHLADLLQSHFTPVESFYVRSHAPAPQIDLNTYRLKVEGLVDRPMELSLEELNRSFSQREIEATLTCAGNRRNELEEIKPVGGVPWGAGAIGNARWRGVPLANVLRAAGIQEQARHVWFEGLDEIPKNGDTIPFGGSIPIEKALAFSNKKPEALLAHEMNGQPLSTDHGWPLRTIVAGYIGARSVKWLGKIVVSDRPSPNHYLQNAYKLVQEATPEAFAQAEPLYEYPVNAVICRASRLATQAAGDPQIRYAWAIRGYALGTGGVTVPQIDVSLDGGLTWQQALTRRSADRPERILLRANPTPSVDGRIWSHWRAIIEEPAQGPLVAVVRATDSLGNSQPQEPVWNAKGYFSNAWHRQELQIEE